MVGHEGKKRASERKNEGGLKRVCPPLVFPPPGAHHQEPEATLYYYHFVGHCGAFCGLKR